jgi:hypothetical protein
MCSTIIQLMFQGGATPTFEYAAAGGLLAIIVLFLVRPTANY